MPNYETLARSLNIVTLRRELSAAVTDGNDAWLLAVRREADRRRQQADRRRPARK